MTKPPSGLTFMGSHLVPELWQAMLPEDFFHFAFPKEEDASCNHCPQVIKAGYTEPYKCCTYIPRVPNFMLGGALAQDRSRAAAAKVLGTFALPEGSLLPPQLYLESLLENAQGKFGKTEKIRCPFLEPKTGGCGIYAFRNSVCATFYCESQASMRGHMFWEKVQAFVGQIETALAHFCMEQLGFDLKEYMANVNRLSADLGAASDKNTKGWNAEVQRQLFGPWADEPREFFLQCYRLVQDHRHELYDIALKQKVYESWEYNRAFYHWLPDEAKKEMERAPPERDGLLIPISDLWYELKLYHRNLWHLPFGEGSLKLNPGLILEENAQLEALSCHYKDRPFRVRPQEESKTLPQATYLKAAEARALAYFAEPRLLDGDLLDHPELGDLPAPRQALAQWLHARILVTLPA